MDYYRVHELPETYKKCKAYTDNFSQWLIRTAKARGIEYQLEQRKWQESNLKKNGRRKSKHKVLISDFVLLAKQIAETDIPIEDKTGLLDLSDAIRTRKEVTQFYRARSICDEEHPFFISKLTEVKKILWRLVPARDHENVIDESQNFTFVIVTPTNEKSIHDDPEEEQKALDISVTFEEPAAAPPSDLRQRYRPPAKALSVAANAQNELELEQDFQVLCFLYDFGRTRSIIQQAWADYQSRKINIITAALVTDLAFANVQQATLGLLEDLKSPVNGRSVFTIISHLYGKFEPSCARVVTETHNFKSKADYRRHFCIDSIRHMQEYQRLKKAREQSGVQYDFDAKVYTFMNFLLFFDQFKSKSLLPPMMDVFTKAMRTTRDGSEPWLAFGLALVYDIHVVIGEKHFEPFNDVAEHIVTLSEMMKSHCDYEDSLWRLSNKPDYMSKGETKFSNYFLAPASSMIDWMDQILENQTKVEANEGLGAVVFMSYHPVLAGLVYYHYHKIYNAMSVSKIGWFVVALCHLYNAARLVGGLDVDWPDLEFIIESHGVNRIFVGDRPTSPSLLYDRFRLAMNSSLRNLTRDGQQRNGCSVSVSRETIVKKRGLKIYQPLLGKIRDYYAAKEDEKSTHLHNIFSYLEHSQSHDDCDTTSLTSCELQFDFANAAQALTRAGSRSKKARNHRNKMKAKVQIPDFEKQDKEEIHPQLLNRMKNELRRLEFESHFDYLSFYRRAFSFVTDIRSDVLYDAKKEVMRLDSSEEPPHNLQLLLELLLNLKIQSGRKTTDKRAKGDEVSKDIIATEQLRMIAKLMKETILESGRHGLDNAAKCLRSWRDASKSVYVLPRGIYHRITFSSSNRPTRRVAVMHSRNLAKPRFVYTPAENKAHCHIVGSRKRHISFRCFAYCSLARLCVGKSASTRSAGNRSGKGRRRVMIHLETTKRLAIQDCRWNSDSEDSDSYHGFQ